MGLIEVSGLTKSYGAKQVLRGIDLSVAEGEIVGVLGPNGAGKTTAVECIGGLRRRDGGTITVAGADPATEPPGLRRLVGMQLQQCRLPAKITTAEALDLFASFYPDPVATTELLERFGLADQARTRFEKLSGGQQQRLSVALALVGRPRIAILDELTTGLDPAARRDIWAYLQDLKTARTTMLLVTHSMEEAQFLCDHVVIIDRGVIVAQGTPDELAAATVEQQTSFDADLAGPPSAEELIGLLRALPGVVTVRSADGRIVVDGDADSPQTILTALMDVGVRPSRLRVIQPTLDEAYLRLTQENR
ncbi:MAG: ABC transporter ATP-binding protein [Propionibacteriaceae bacterium]|nr:ABC transporter ATP-binding protein [Propionibacteriaceae bacterium]